MKISVLSMVFLTVSHSYLTSADDAMIQKVCQGSSFCTSLLKSDPRSRNATAVGLTKIVLEKFSDLSQSALDVVKNVTDCTTILRSLVKVKPASVQDDLPNCEMRFETTVSSVPRMSAGVEQGDVSSVLPDLFYLEQTTKRCSVELSEHKCGEYSPLVKLNDLWDAEVRLLYSMVQNLSS